MPATATQPTPGHPVPRDGKPYIYTTWLAKLLGGEQCAWKVWFTAHYKHAKYELMALDLAKWSREHDRLMRARVQELREAGFTVTTENQNDFKLEGKTATVAGKPDIVATLPETGLVQIIDGKTGRQRQSDQWQVLIYMYAWLIDRGIRPDRLSGEVQYRDDERLDVPIQALDDGAKDDIVRMIAIIASPTPPKRAPSRDECKRCNIGPLDCPERFKERKSGTATEDF